MTKSEYFVFMDDLGFKIPNATKVVSVLKFVIFSSFHILFQERMFSFADEDGDGAVELSELEDTWTYFKEVV